jgi:hypothetical protein
MSEPPANGNDLPDELDAALRPDTESSNDVPPTAEDKDSGAPGESAAANSKQTSGSRDEQPGPPGAEDADVEVFYEDIDPITLPEAFIDAGGTSELPGPPHDFTAAHISRLGRFFLRIIGVDTSAVPAGEQWKLYGLAATVVLNAGLAAVFVPIGATVAYGTLSRAEIAIGAALGFFTIGIIDALVVGQWHNYAKHFTRIDPDAPIPKMPGTLARCAVLAPRLLVTAGIVSTLGLMITLAVNQQAVHQEMATQDAEHNKATRTSLLAPDAAAIATATAKIAQDSKARLADLAAANRYQQLASCESLGFPIVPGCSGHIGYGQLWRRYSSDASTAAADANTQQQNINTERTAISNAQAHELAVEHSPQYTQSMIQSTGIIAATSAYDGYVQAHHVPWYDAWRMGLLLAVLDLTPLLIKLGSGTTQYEAEQWWRAYRNALLAHYHDSLWHRILKANQQLLFGVAEVWVPAGVDRAARRLTRAKGRPPRRSVPQAVLPPPAPLPVAIPASEPKLKPRPPRGDDPFNLGRNARLGDVIHLSDGEYILLARLTREESANADVFIGVEVPKPGQLRPVARNRNPVRAVKLTKLDKTGEVLRMSDAELALLDSFPVDSALLEPNSLTESHDGRIAYTMHYHPRGDAERYSFGSGPDRPRLTNEQAVDVGLVLVRALQKLWDMGLIHNDARLRNILLTGPLLGDSERLSMLVPGPHDRAVLTDYNFISRLNGTYHDPPGLVVNALDGDPALVRWMLEHCDEDGMASPLTLACDCYASFAVVYALLTGGLSPTAALLRARGWDRQAMQRFDTPDSVETWRDLLVGYPRLLREDPPSLTGFGVPNSLAQVVDAGVRADPMMRQPQFAGAGDINPAFARGYIEEELIHARDRTSHRWLRQPIPQIHEGHPWRGLIKAPVGFPYEVIEYLGRHWPAFVKGGSS